MQYSSGWRLGKSMQASRVLSTPRPQSVQCLSLPKYAPMFLIEGRKMCPSQLQYKILLTPQAGRHIHNCSDGLQRDRVVWSLVAFAGQRQSGRPSALLWLARLSCTRHLRLLPKEVGKVMFATLNMAHSVDLPWSGLEPATGIQCVSS